MQLKSAPLILVTLVSALAVSVLFLWTREGEEERAGTTTAEVASDSMATELAEAAPAALEMPGEADESRTDVEIEEEVEEDAPVRVVLTAENSRYVEGLVVMPEGTPTDEKLFVLALDRHRTAAGLFGEDAIADGAWDETIDRTPLISFAEVAPDNTFRLAVPKDADSAHLAVSGRYVYSQATTEFQLPVERDAVRLTGELGAWISGRLELPGDGVGPVAAVGDTEIGLGPDVTGGFDAMRFEEIAFTMEAQAEADGGFEFRAVPCSLAHGIVIKRDDLAAYIELGLRTKPGDHLQRGFALANGATVSGRVVDESGAGIADADVDVMFPGPIGRGIAELRETNTDADGGFVLSNVYPGKVELKARSEGYRSAKLRLEEELVDGQTLEGVELVLEGGSSIAGHVRFPDGAPATEANVYASMDFSNLGPMGFAGGGFDPDDKGSDETNEEGAFRITGLGSGAFQVIANMEVEEGERIGNWSTRIKGIHGDGEPLELLLERMTDLVGLVEDAEGAPITEFEVRATMAGSGAMFGIGAERGSWPFTEAEDGRFEVENLRGGEWEFTVAAEDYATSAPQTVTVPMAEDQELFFELVPAARVSGVVLGTNGEPVSGADVTLELDLAKRITLQQTGGVPSTISDADGKFLLEDIDPGPLSLVAAHNGYASSEPVAREVGSGERAENVVLVLRVGGTLTGEILDDAGEPDAGRMIIVQRVPNYNTQHMLTSDERGSFHVENLEPGSWQVVATANFLTGEMDTSTSDDGGMSALLENMEMDMVDIEDGVETHVVLGRPAEDPVHVRGRVTHAGDPVPGSMVSFVPEDAGGFGNMEMVFTDEVGSFEAELEHRGAMLVTVQQNPQMGRQNSVEFMERIPAAVEEYEIELELPLGRISGRVRGPDGDRLADCRITLNVDGGIAYGSFLGGNYVETVTDEDGRYELDYLRPGSYTVSAGGSSLGGLLGGNSAGGRVVRKGIDVEEGREKAGVDFQLEPSCELTGVVYAPDGTPAGNASVFIRDEDGSLLERFSIVTTDGSGRYTYKGLAPGKYTISAKRGDEVSGESNPVRVSPEDAGEARVALGPGTIVRVVVVDKSEDEIRARISVVDPDGNEVSGMLSMAEILEAFGEGFSGQEQRVGPLPPGVYTVSAELDDGRRVRKEIKLTGQEERKVKLRIK